MDVKQLASYENILPDLERFRRFDVIQWFVIIFWNAYSSCSSTMLEEHLLLLLTPEGVFCWKQPWSAYLLNYIEWKEQLAWLPPRRKSLLHD